MRSKEAIVRAQLKYDKTMLRRFTIRLHKSLDESIIKHLEGKENMTAYIKQLIRSDMEKGGE